MVENIDISVEQKRVTNNAIVICFNVFGLGNVTL